MTLRSRVMISFVAVAIAGAVFLRWHSWKGASSAGPSQPKDNQESRNALESQGSDRQSITQRSKAEVLIGCCDLSAGELKEHWWYNCPAPLMRDVLSSVLQSGCPNGRGPGSLEREGGPFKPAAVLNQFFFRSPCVGRKPFGGEEARPERQPKHGFPTDLVVHNKVVDFAEIVGFLSLSWQGHGGEEYVAFGWPIMNDSGTILLPQCHWKQPGEMTFWLLKIEKTGDEYSISELLPCCSNITK